MTHIRKEEEGGGNHAHRAGDGDELKEKIKKLKSHFANKIVGVKIKLSELHSAETQK